MDEPLNTATASFDALYRDCAHDPYAYVHKLRDDDAAAEDVDDAGQQASAAPCGIAPAWTHASSRRSTC
jgi:hypothetical protein